MKFKFVGLLGLIWFLIGIGLTVAQGTCPMIVEQALQSLGDNCDDLGRNSACYGYNLVTAEFSEAVGDDFFSQPADITELGILETIRTSEMSVDTSQWGVAIMNLQANIPNSIPGQAVKFVLLGDVDVESAVEPLNAFQNADAIDATVVRSANIRSGAGLTFNVVGGASVGDAIPIDGQSVDGEWYRTVVGSRVGWIFGDLLDPNESLASIPVIDGTQRSLMQSFYLRTGFGAPACEEAPEDTLMIQSPQGIEIDLTVNGADISIGSTILSRILSPGNIIELTVIDGKIVIPGAGPNGTDLIVYENHRTTACLSEPNDRGIDGNSNDRVVNCEWTTPEFIPDAILGETYCILEDMPANILNYPINLPCSNDELVVQDTSPATNQTSGGVIKNCSEEHIQELNLCFAGNAWGDGRCTSDYWWNAGYFYGQYEASCITYGEIPESYRSQDPETETETDPTEKIYKRCKEQVGSSAWYILNIKTGAYIKEVYKKPNLPDC